MVQLIIQLLKYSTIEFFNSWNSSTIELVNLSSIQVFNYSAIQLFRHSAIQLFSYCIVG